MQCRDHNHHKPRDHVHWKSDRVSGFTRRDAIFGIVGSVVFGPQACAAGSTDTLIGTAAQQPISVEWGTARADIPAMIGELNRNFLEMTGHDKMTIVATQQCLRDLGIDEEDPSMDVIAL